MKKNAALELQFNFIIIIILSVVVLIFSTVLLKNVLTHSSKMTSQVSQNLRNRIEKIMIDNGKSVALPFNFVHMHGPGVAKFPIGIKNNLNNCHVFKIFVKRNDPIGYTFDHRPISDSPELEKNIVYSNLFRSGFTVDVLKNDVAVRYISIDIKHGLDKGIYIFNVSVECNNTIYGDPLKAYIVYD